MRQLLDRRYIYFPAPWETGDWARVSGLPLEEWRFSTNDGVLLHGWWVPAAGSPAVVLLCHGNAGNIIHRLELLHELHRRGLSAAIFDYRGYGRSTGAPSEDGLYRDAQAAYDALVQAGHATPERLVLWGTSLGAAVAGDLATQRAAAGVILETPFPSVRAMVQAYYGAMPLHWLLSARFDLSERLAHLRAPLLVIHGDRDSIVPTALGQVVFAAAREPKEWYLIPGSDHNDTYIVGGEAYFQRVLAFIRRVTAAAP